MDPTIVLGIGLVLGLVVLAVGGALWFTITRLLYVATPNEALIFSGSTRRLGGKSVGYRFVRGGRRIRIPLVERVDRLDLSMFTVHVHVTGAFSKGGVPLTVQGVANVKLPGEEPLLANAVERFLGRSRDQIYFIAKETLEGNLRGVLASLTPEEVNENKLRFAQILLEEAEHDMTRMGLVLDTLKIQNVTDEVNYLSSIGRIRGAALNQKQAIAECFARSEAEVQEASNWSASEVAKLDADLQIALRETERRIAEATSRREALIQEAIGQVGAETAKVRAEIERQKARSLKERKRLEADIVQPALAAQRAAEESAKGRAAVVIERGRAEAAGLKKLVEVVRAGGSSAREALALQTVLPLLDRISGATQPLKLARLTVLPEEKGGAGDLSRLLIGTNAQVKAATGADLAAALPKNLPKAPLPR